MLLRTKLHGQTYEFPDLRILMGKANEAKFGDRLASVAAETAAERVAARFALAEMPLWVLREHPAIPYEQDEVTRIIQDAVQETVYQEIKGWTVGQLREWLLADTTTGAMIHRISTGLTAEMIAAVTKLMSNLDLIYCAKKYYAQPTVPTSLALPAPSPAATSRITLRTRLPASALLSTKGWPTAVVTPSSASTRSMMPMTPSPACST
jgi:ethanolamine ammonia-lyase large subunit